jgi:hypothetical protein
VRFHRRRPDPPCPSCERERRHAKDLAEQLAGAHETIRNLAVQRDDARGRVRELIAEAETAKARGRRVS